MTFRRRLYLTLDPSEKGGVPERIFEVLLILIIILNIVAIVMDSIDQVHEDYRELFYQFELFSVMFFTIEYVARVYSIVESPNYSDGIKGRLTFIVSPLALIDLLAFLPFYFIFLPFDLRFLRIFRLMGLFRMFKIARYLRALDVFSRVIRHRKEHLVISLIFILFMLVIISTIMYYVEKSAQPEAFSSIPATMWWGIATLTTVGYGDIVPVTPLGKLLGGLFGLVGICLFALPAGILSSGFYELMHKDEIVVCPHCGKEIHE